MGGGWRPQKKTILGITDNQKTTAKREERGGALIYIDEP